MTELRAIAEDIWDAEFVRREGVHIRSRMVVVRLPGARLWLHSPIPIEDELASDLASLGQVGFVVAPNCFHHLFAQSAMDRFPNAQLWGPHCLARKQPGASFAGYLDRDRPPTWDPIESLLVAGFPTPSETVFFHAPSRTLVCTDLLFRITAEPHVPTRIAYRMLGVMNRGLCSNRIWPLFRRNREQAEASAAQILHWGPTRIVMAHGEIVEDDSGEALRDALRWMSAG